mgnify:CR=1 FL=1
MVAAMGGTTHEIHDLRELLLAARCSNDHAALSGVIDGVQTLGRNGYRCCLVDFDKCRPVFYVRLLGYEKTRVAAELEFPIAPELDRVQHVPLSHLIDYDEADPQQIRNIYRQLSPYLHHRRARLRRASACSHRDLAPRRLTRNRLGVRRPSSMIAWWLLAALLFLSSLVVFFVA